MRRPQSKGHRELTECERDGARARIAHRSRVRYAQHLAGTGARYTRASPPRRLLVKFACLNRSVAGRMEAAIKKLTATNKRILVGKNRAVARKFLFD